MPVILSLIGTYQNIMWYYALKLWYWAIWENVNRILLLLTCWSKSIPDSGEKIRLEVSVFSSDLPSTISYHTWFLWPSLLSLCDHIMVTFATLSFIWCSHPVGRNSVFLATHWGNIEDRVILKLYTNQTYWQIWQRILVLWLGSLSPLKPFFIGLSAAFWGGFFFPRRAKF